MGWYSPSRKFQGRNMRKRSLLVSVMREFRIMDEMVMEILHSHLLKL